MPSQKGQLVLCHAIVNILTQQSFLAVLQLEVLVLELVTVDALAASAIAIGEVTALDHELLDYAVECRALVTVALLARCQSSEVLSCLWYRLAIKANDNSANLLIPMLDVEVDLV